MPRFSPACIPRSTASAPTTGSAWAPACRPSPRRCAPAATRPVRFIGGYPLQASFRPRARLRSLRRRFSPRARCGRTPGGRGRPRGGRVDRSAPVAAVLRVAAPVRSALSVYAAAAVCADRADAGDAARYDGEVAYTDAALGRLFEHLQQSGPLRRAPPSSSPPIMASRSASTASGRTARFSTTRLIRVPLFIRLPGAATPRDGDAVPVEAADLAPTIAAVAGASLGAVDGRSLLPLVRLRAGGSDAAAGDPDRPAYAESYHQNVLLGWSPLRGRADEPVEVHRGAATRAVRSRQPIPARS